MTVLADRVHRAVRRFVVAPLRRRASPELEVRVAGHRYRIDLRDRVIGSLLYVNGDYEQYLRAVFQRLDLANTVCVDVGANLGLHTVWLADAVGPDGSVIAVEPERRNLELLHANVALNKLRNVRVHPVAMSERSGFVSLSIDRTNFGNHQLSDVSASSKQPVELVPGDELLAAVEPGRIGLIKVDVQGHELSVIRGLRRILERNPQVVVAIEISPAHLRDAGTSATELVSELRAMGFDGWELQRQRVLPLLSPEQYEWMSWQEHADLILCRDIDRIRPAIREFMRELGGDAVP